VAADWIASLESQGTRTEPAAAEVQLLEYPVRLGIRQEERTVELVREFQLITLDTRHQSGTVPSQLLDFAATLYDQYGPALSAPRADLERANALGRVAITLTYPLRPDSVGLMVRYARLMEEADDFCRVGRLISLAPDDEVHALRRWTVEEFVRQYHGHAPRAWTAAVRDALA
jgi:hypothetical protein